MTDRHTGRHLLPLNATRYEVAQSLVSAEHRDDIPWDDLDAVFDPFRCPARLLPWLATVFSVDLWFEDWPERKKREVIAGAILLHRRKGTLGGIKAYLDLIGVKVPRAVTPPAKFFLSNYTQADHQRWLNSLPEIRVYHGTLPVDRPVIGALTDTPQNVPDGTEGTSHRRFFLADIANVAVEKQSGALFSTSADETAPKVRNIMRAELVENGVVTPLDMESANEIDARTDVQSSVERLYFREKRGRGLFCSQLGSSDPPPGVLDHAVTTDVKTRKYAAYVRRSGNFAEKTVSPVVRGREVVDDDPVRVPFPTARRKAPYFLGQVRRFFASAKQDQKFDYYESWRLVDKTRPATRGPALSFLDRDRFGIPPYTAELVIDYTEPAPKRGFFLNYTPLGKGYLIQNDYSAIKKIRDVVRIAKAKRDVVLLDFNYHIPTPLDRVYDLDDLTMR